MEKYDKQVKEIELLAELIVSKSKRFAERNAKNQNFDDLTHVLEELRGINDFIK